jgi:glycine dehydrogenase subunit 2
LMITIPNTLGIFEEEIVRITEVVHAKGGMVYCDGANLNALLCRVNFKKMGVDAMHMNLHKTFSTPHGGGGPGAGPVACVSRLAPFLPSPYISKKDDQYVAADRGSQSIGRLKPYFGSFAVLLRAYAYILAYGGEGLRQVSNMAVLNANYIREKLKPYYDLPFTSPTLHEVVFSDKNQKEFGVSTMDIAKRLMDYGFHPPTVYFPLIVRGALMIEPTETVNRRELDRFVDAMIAIANESRSQADLVKNAPHMMGVKRFDEVRAARKPILTWNKHWHED